MNKINTAFILRKSKEGQDGKAPIIMRITINRETVDISTCNPSEKSDSLEVENF